MRELDRLHAGSRARGFDISPGTIHPIVGIDCDLSKVVRALMKIGFQSLVRYAQKTNIRNDVGFRRTRDIICGAVELSASELALSGFVAPCGMIDISKPASHAIRLSHNGEIWNAYLSFFGGRICAVAIFEGPNDEDWNSADFSAPIGAKDWSVKTSILALPIKVQIEMSVPRMIPSIGWKEDGTS